MIDLTVIPGPLGSVCLCCLKPLGSVCVTVAVTSRSIQTKAWSEKKKCACPHMGHDFLVRCGAFVVSVDVLDTYGGGRHAPSPTAGCFFVPPVSHSLLRVKYASS